VIRVLWKFAFALTVLLVMPVLLIRAQPYNDHALRTFLTPPSDCPAPCFMGIRPGVTMAWDALDMLEANQQVNDVLENFGNMRPEVIDYQLPPMLSIIDWHWNDTQWIEMEKHGSLVMFDRQVSAINLYTNYTLGDLLLTYGFPDADKLTLSSSGQFGDQFQYDAWYAYLCMRITATGLGRLRGFYRYPVNISFEKQRPDVYDTPLADSQCGA
jgi:hypothetical protein